MSEHTQQDELTVRVIEDDACCGLTWITTGQLTEAKRIAARTACTAASA